MFRRISLIAFFVGLSPVTSYTAFKLVLAYGATEILDHGDLFYVWLLHQIATMDSKENVTRGVQFSEWLMGSVTTWWGETVFISNYRPDNDNEAQAKSKYPVTRA